MRQDANRRFLCDARPARGVTDIAEALYKIPALLTTWTRCGNATCRCNTGHLHGPYHTLYWREGKVQRRRYLRAGDVPAVQAILAQRRAQRVADRVALALATQTWRALRELIVDYEADLQAAKEGP